MNKLVAIITGGTSELGGEVAELMTKNYKVYLGFRNLNNYTLRVSGVTPLKLDLTQNASCQRAVKTVVSKEGRIDLLINLAGQTIVGPWDSFSDKEFLDLLDINCVGAFRMIKAVVPELKKTKGKIINVTSLSALLAFPNYSLYSASKFAFEAFGESIYYELRSHGVSVVNLAIGAVQRLTIQEQSKYKTARQKFWLIRWLMPMLTVSEVSVKIARLAQKSNPPQCVLMGRDTQISWWLNKFLIGGLWSRIVFYVWSKK